MFLLRNDNLPSKSKVDFRLAPAFTVGQAPPPAFLLVPGKGLPKFELGDWEYVGYRYSYDLNYEVLKVAVAGFEESPDPVSLRPEQQWINLVSGQINLYSLSPISNPVNINFFYSLEFVEVGDSKQLSFYVPNDEWVVSQIYSQGNWFYPSDTQAAGTFHQVGKLITLYLSPVYRAFTPLLVGIAIAVPFELQGKVLSVYENRFSLIQSINTLGATFWPTENIELPNNYEFVWDGEMLSLFVPDAIAGGISAKVKPTQTYSSSLGSLSV